MSTPEKPIDVRKIREFIKSGLQALPPDKYHEEAVIVLGDTGVGKSTLLTLLSGAKMFVKYDGIKVSLHSENSGNSKIGHTKFSETFVPMKVLAKNIAFFDCPGFNDNQCEQFEIANSFFLQRVLDNYRRVKIVIMVEESHISEVRADRFPRLIHNLFAFFGNFQDIANGCCLIISRADPDNQKQDYKEEIKNMTVNSDNKSPFFNEEECKLLSFLVENNRILLFRQPQRKTDPYEYQMGVEEQQILPMIKEIKSVKSRHITHHCSETSKLAIRKLIDEIISKSKNKFQAVFSCLTNKLTQEMLLKGDEMQSLLEIKEKIEQIQVQLKEKEGKQILTIFRSLKEAPEILDIQEDIVTVQFFNAIYNKEKFFYQTVKNLLIAESNEAFSRLEKNITQVISNLTAKLERQSREAQQKIIEKQELIKLLKNQQNQETVKMVNELDEQSKAKKQYYWSKLAQIEEQRAIAQKQHEKKVETITLSNQQRQQERELALEKQKADKLLQIQQMKQNQVKMNEDKAQFFQRLNKKEEQYYDVTSKIIEKMKRRAEGRIQKEISRRGQLNSREKIIIDDGEKLEILTEFTKCEQKKQEKEEKNEEKQKADERKIETEEFGRENEELKNSTSSLKKLKSFEEKKAEIIIQSLKIEEELSQFILNIKKRRQNELKELEKSMQNKSIAQPETETNKYNYSPQRASRRIGQSRHLLNYDARLRESAPAAFSKRRNQLPEEIFNTPRKNTEMKPISFQNFKTNGSKWKKQRSGSIYFEESRESQKEPREVDKDRVIVSGQTDLRRREIIRDRDGSKNDKKSMRPTSCLISEINQVLLNLNNISGDLQKAKMTVIKLSDKNCLPLSHLQTINTLHPFNQA